jgi:hypothetical protein
LLLETVHLLPERTRIGGGVMVFLDFGFDRGENLRQRKSDWTSSAKDALVSLLEANGSRSV